MKVCPKCKKEMVENAMFCTKCGAELEEVSVENVVETPETKVQELVEEEKKVEPKEKKESKKSKKNGNPWMAVLATICVVVICITICVVVLKDRGNVADIEEATTQQQTTEVATQEVTAPAATTESTTEATTTESSVVTTDYVIDSSMLRNLAGLVGDTYILSFGDYTTDIAWDEIVWENQNPEIVKLDTNTLDIEYLAAGKATILATYQGTTYGCVVVVGEKDPSKYPVAMECELSNLELTLGGEYNGDNYLTIDYTVSGDYPSTAEVLMQTTNFLDDALFISGYTVLSGGTFALDVYPYEGTGDTGITTILWDPVTAEIYGINVLPVSIK